MRKNINKTDVFYGAGLLLLCATLFLGIVQYQQVTIGEKLRKTVLRFHVLANSDEPLDQERKLRVRDALLHQIRPLLSGATNLEEAICVLSGHKQELADCAREILLQEGCDLPVKVEFVQAHFPVKEYGHLVMPAGDYQALRVSIGSGEGKNWWCMLFPGLCLVDGSYELSKEELELLEEQLTTEELQAIWQDEDVPVKIRFRLWDWCSRLIHCPH